MPFQYKYVVMLSQWRSTEEYLFHSGAYRHLDLRFHLCKLGFRERVATYLVECQVR